jgi:hypothetical protein
MLMKDGINGMSTHYHPLMHCGVIVLLMNFMFDGFSGVKLSTCKNSQVMVSPQHPRVAEIEAWIASPGCCAIQKKLLSLRMQRPRMMPLQQALQWNQRWKQPPLRKLSPPMTSDCKRLQQLCQLRHAR